MITLDTNNNLLKPIDNPWRSLPHPWSQFESIISILTRWIISYFLPRCTQAEHFMNLLLRWLLLQTNKNIRATQLHSAKKKLTLTTSTSTGNCARTPFRLRRFLGLVKPEMYNRLPALGFHSRFEKWTRSGHEWAACRSPIAQLFFWLLLRMLQHQTLCPGFPTGTPKWSFGNRIFFDNTMINIRSTQPGH